ncbi:MAG: alanine racemase [Phycisphaerales bacterium]
MSGTSVIEIDLTALERNLALIRGVLSCGLDDGPGAGSQPAPQRGPGVCAVLKADGYGLGAVRLAKRLVAPKSTRGVEMIAVYTPEEARELIEAAIPVPILVLMPVSGFDRHDPLYHALSKGQIHLTIHDRDNLDAIMKTAEHLGAVLPVHLKIDTGMSRGGATPREAGALLGRIAAHPRLRLAGVFTHFACADSNADITRDQAQSFLNVLRLNEARLPGDCVIHESNSYGVFRSAALHADMVRCGLGLLGYCAESMQSDDRFEFRDAARQLCPVLRWTSRVVQTKHIAPGTPVGYGSVWTAPRRSAGDTRLAIVPVGYADGYPVALSSDRGGDGSLDPERTARVGFEISTGIRAFAPVVGRVSMDQIIVDITDLPEQSIGVGAGVEIVGHNPGAPNHLPTLAKLAGTITHELLCRLSPRIERRYLHLPKPVEQERPAERIDRALAGPSGLPTSPLALREVETKRLMERMGAAKNGIR